MGQVTLSTEEYDDLRNQYRVLTPFNLEYEIEQAVYFGQTVKEWRERALAAEARIADQEADAALGRLVTAMPPGSMLQRNGGNNLFNVILSAQSASTEHFGDHALPEDALRAAGIKE